MKPMLASIDRMNSATTRRSARLARAGSGGSVGSSRRAGGEPPSPGRSPSMVRACAGGGVPITRWGPAGGSVGSLGGPPGAPVSLISGLPVLGGDPERGQHHKEQQAQERD